MQPGTRANHASVVGCEELAVMGLMDTAGCCEICHSAERYAPGGSLGPCRATLPNGTRASVCCAGKKRLLGEEGP